ncbi:MAG: TIGR04255 family protein [Planctomycetes bacterium]|nr:TIGR04255 family protein [Planctomycetota bacterium]
MNTGWKYKKPPVVEALCELHFEDSAWDETVPGRFYDSVKDGGFPVKRQKEVQEAQVSISSRGEAHAGVRRLPPWMQFVSESGDRLIQLGRDLLVVNQLQPYPRFDDWEPVIQTALKIYRELAEPKAIAAIGVRYINRVVIPLPRIQMEDYFTIYPRLPQATGDQHGAFMLRVELPAQKGGHSVLVTFGSAPADKPEEIAHLLDFYDTLRPSTSLRIEAAAAEIRTAHDNVEVAFEGSITEKLRQLFEPEGRG